MILLFTITLLSIALAGVASVFAWRLARDERRRSEARVQALAAEIRETTGDEKPAPVVVNGLFTAEMRAEPSTSFRALSIGAVVVSATLATVLTLGSGDHSAARSAAASEAPGFAETVSLELMSLEHEVESGGLVIRGTVIERSGGPSNPPLTATIFALNRDGVVVGSGLAPLENAAMSTSGGVESSFVVRITGVGEIQRYRVSFRSGDRTISHVDRRARLVTAQLP
jgi:hypothetical protein